MVPTVAVLHHLELPFLGHAEAALEGAGVAVEHCDLRRGEALPSLSDIDGVLSLGGDQSACELARHPYLAAEVELLAEAAGARGIPVLGICLGGQLLARALGGRVERMVRRTVGWAPLRPLAPAAADPLFRTVGPGAMALHWNEDCFSLPPSAVELAAPTGPGCEAFRHGDDAWGVQFHPEVDAEALDDWYRSDAGWLSDAGVSEADARAQDARHLAGQRATGAALFGGFARVVATSASVRTHPSVQKTSRSRPLR